MAGAGRVLSFRLVRFSVLDVPSKSTTASSALYMTVKSLYPSGFSKAIVLLSTFTTVVS